MTAVATPEPQTYPPILGWRRVRVAMIPVAVFFLPMSIGWTGSRFVLLARLILEALSLVAVFGLFERWPRKLPGWLARWGLQVLGVAVTAPVAVFSIYCLTTFGDNPSWIHQSERLIGFGMLTFLGVLIGPWMVVAALFRQIRGEAEKQALAFELERSELERRALDARMNLLQAQVEPHFLFNTLANVRELVDAGSSQASAVLGNLIAYLRAAVPRLQESGATMRQEIELVRAYLEVMHMRMPDRLQFTVNADEEALALACPPMTLLTLVENAVRHGIDPSEQGGRIEVRVRLRDGRCRAEVIDTGVGLVHARDGMGTGLDNLRERLQLAFGGDAQLRLSALEPHGACAEVEFPARGSAP